MQKNDKKMKRKYFSESFGITTWEKLEAEFEKLLARKIGSADELIDFWQAVSELDKIIEDKANWLYIDMTRYSDKAELRDAFNDFMATIGAKSQPYSFKLNKKFYDSEFRRQLPPKYGHLNRIIANDMELFREENIPLSVKDQELAVKYGEMVSKMTVMFQGEEKTVQQLDPYLEDQDRNVREQVWRLKFDRYAQNQSAMDSLFDKLKKIRVQMAKNAGFENYRDYIHQTKGRFSYTPEDLLKLHEVIEKNIVPLIDEFDDERKKKLGLAVLKPWDFDVSIGGELPKPFETHEELLTKGIRTIANVDPVFGKELEKMRAGGFIDAENRKAKAPGGYCTTIYEYGSSFIFMHAVGVERDVYTLVHEAGHAMHNMLSKDQPIIQYISVPQEVAELASMGMELISLDHWDEFYDQEALKIVRKNELMDKIIFLPWGATVDAFQHWIYLNPDHTPAQRGEYFAKLLDRFKIGGDWTGLEKEKAMRWMLQLHIFERPFYYIEYVMAQLGAIAIYRNYKKDPQKTIGQYKDFLKMAYTKPVAEVYETAGVPFDFSQEYVSQLADFIRSELKK